MYHFDTQKSRSDRSSLIPWLAIAVLTTVAILSLGNTAGAAPAPKPTAVPQGQGRPVAGPVAVHGATPELAARAEWARHRFADAGLILPALDITFHDSGAACHGNTGWYELVGHVGDIEICMPTRHIVLHELAHAWIAENVTPQTRSRVAAYWGLETWNDQGVPWSNRASERAADTIAFVLDGLPANPPASLMRYVCAFPLLTGRPAPVDGGKSCPAESVVPDRVRSGF